MDVDDFSASIGARAGGGDQEDSDGEADAENTDGIKIDIRDVIQYGR